MKNLILSIVFCFAMISGFAQHYDGTVIESYRITHVLNAFGEKVESDGSLLLVEVQGGEELILTTRNIQPMTFRVINSFTTGGKAIYISEGLCSITEQGWYIIDPKIEISIDSRHITFMGCGSGIQFILHIENVR